MKSGSGSINEGVSRYQPFTQFVAPTESKCKSNFWLNLYETRTDTHIHMGRTSRAGQEWRVEMVLRRVTSRPRWYRLLRRTCFRLLREIVTLQARCFTTAGSYSSGQRDHGEGYYHSTCLAITDCTCHLQTQHKNILFSKTTAVLSLAYSAVN
jgi:hypothetical protein